MSSGMAPEKPLKERSRRSSAESWAPKPAGSGPVRLFRASASARRRRHLRIEGVGGEVEDLEEGKGPELVGERAVERVPVEDEALERGRAGDERGRDGAEEAVAAEVEVAQRGRERRRRERRKEALLGERERDDAAGLGGVGGGGGAGDAVPGAGVRGGGVPVGERARGVLDDGRLERQQRLAVRRERVGGGEEEQGEQEETERHGDAPAALGGERVGDWASSLRGVCRAMDGGAAGGGGFTDD